MIRKCILIALAFIHSVHAWQLACPQGCGGASDPDVLYVAGKLLKSLQNIEFLEREVRIWHEGETNTYKKIHPYKNGEIIWEATHDIDLIEEDDEEIEEETYWFSRDQSGNSSHFSTQLESYLHTEQLIQYALHDIDLFFLERKAEKERKIQAYRNELEESWEERQYYRSCIDREMQSLARMQSKRDAQLLEFEKTKAEVQKIYQEIFEECSRCHKWIGAFYGRGLLSFERGELEDAFDSIDQLFALHKETKEKDLLPTEAYFHKGIIESEAGYYDDAILSLSHVIAQDPKNKQAYFERAVAYFEMGKFEESLSDYLASDTKSFDSSIKGTFSLDYAEGLLKGMKKGVQEEFADMLPMWAPIMNVGLWALTYSQVPSAKLITATLSCIAAAGVYFAADQMVAELKELVTNWNQLSEGNRGELAGYLIGKYGVDVFAFAGSAKVMEAYRNLKRANQLLNFEIILTDQAHLAQIKARYKVIEKFKRDETYIQKNFGRKVYTEKEIRSHLLKKGYPIPDRPSGIPEHFITRFSDKGCGISYHDPANPNYNYIRLMPGKPHSPNPHQQIPYIVHVKDGKTLNATGRPIPSKEPQAHISPDQYVYRP